jgi:hypothetical protein
VIMKGAYVSQIPAVSGMRNWRTICPLSARRITYWSWLRMLKLVMHARGLGRPRLAMAAPSSPGTTTAHSPNHHHARFLHIAAIASHGACEASKQWQKQLPSRNRLLDRVPNMVLISSASS